MLSDEEEKKLPEKLDKPSKVIKKKKKKHQTIIAHGLQAVGGFVPKRKRGRPAKSE